MRANPAAGAFAARAISNYTSPTEWASLMESLPEEPSRQLAVYRPLRESLALALYDEKEAPICLSISLRRIDGAAMTLRYFWSREQPTSDLIHRMISNLDREARSRGIAVIRAAPSLSPHLCAPGQDKWEQWLGPDRNGKARIVPVSYPQTTEFTCGPASLLMAMSLFKKETVVDWRLEVELWREATTIFSLAGPGGCDPYGLALAAWKRGLDVQMFVNTELPILDRGNTERKRKLMALVQEDFKTAVVSAGIAVHRRPWMIGELKDAVKGGSAAIVLIDQMRSIGHSVPHWILVHSADDGYLFANDPWIEPERSETIMDVMDVPLTPNELDHMSWFGETPHRAMILLHQRAPTAISS